MKVSYEYLGFFMLAATAGELWLLIGVSYLVLGAGMRWHLRALGLGSKP